MAVSILPIHLSIHTLHFRKTSQYGSRPVDALNIWKVPEFQKNQLVWQEHQLGQHLTGQHLFQKNQLVWQLSIGIIAPLVRLDFRKTSQYGSRVVGSYFRKQLPSGFQKNQLVWQDGHIVLCPVRSVAVFFISEKLVSMAVYLFRNSNTFIVSFQKNQLVWQRQRTMRR